MRSSGLFRDIDASTAERLTQQADLFQLEPNEVLFEQDDEATFMCVVLEGSLEAVDGSRPGTTDRLGIIKPGEPVGEIALLLGGKRSARVRAIEHSTVARFDSADFNELVKSSPALKAGLETIIQERLKRNRITQAVQSLFGGLSVDALRYILEQLEFHQLKRNEYLFRAGDPGDSLYLVVSGSLEVVADDSGGPGQVVAHVRRGQPIGEMALLAGDARGASIRAGRHSELVSLSRSSFEKLSLQYPDILLGITRVLVNRFRSVSGQSNGGTSYCRSYLVYSTNESPRDSGETTADIIEAMPDGIRATVISPQTVEQTFHRSATEAGRLALESWIDEIEARHDVVFFLPDDPASERGADTSTPWFDMCLKRCDEVLLLADANADPAPGAREQDLLGSDRT
ncbi:MAG: cyclic nucleotide-binding domain-containing protein, partial [Spirochaetaceae bacterium]